MNSFRGRTFRSKIVRLKKVLVQLSECSTEEINNLIDEEQFRLRRLWVRKWIRIRETRGASALLLKELSVEDSQEYRLCLRLTPESFETLLNLIAPVIQRTDTKLRDAIPARVKVEVTLLSYRKQLQNSPTYILCSKTIRIKVRARRLRCNLRSLK